MKRLLILALALALAAPAAAFDLGTAQPPKPQVTYPVQPPDPARQGGDTFEDALFVYLPLYDAFGTTIGYTNDYDEVCPYPGSTSPDVVYSFEPYDGQSVDIDMLGSTYDTKIYLYDEDLDLVACNDDFYPDYVSKLENIPLEGGVTYYLVIDGYGGDAGDYVLNIELYTGHGVWCPPYSELENEPPLENGYLDAHNGGCNSPEFGNPFGTITQQTFCGVSGWYQNSEGTSSRDTDWFEIIVPEAGYLEITGEADFATYLFELGPQDCGSVGVVQSVVCGYFDPATLVIPGEVGSTVWFWVGPTTFEDYLQEYDYTLYTNLEPSVAVAPHSWSYVKGLFD